MTTNPRFITANAQKVLTALGNPKSKYRFRTLTGLCDETKLSEKVVLSILNQTSGFVRRTKNASGEVLFRFAT